jgi:D-alanyl-D-alanine carboxypeptidase/D-alanyl-D-alanine-endopeptidase (penicillin-binding protein 4)
MRVFLPLLLLLCSECAPAQTLATRIQRILETPGAGTGAFWGIHVVDAETGVVRFRHDAGRYFVPASNTKLFTTALALVRLGPDHRFVTTVTASAAPDSHGTIRGDLRLAGRGDPMLSARAVPYQNSPILGDPLQAIEALAEQTVAAGVRNVNGDIVGDDTAYVWTPYPEGWAQEDGLWDYGAPASALTISDNTVVLTVHPSSAGALLTVSPPLEYYSVDNRVRVGPGLEHRVRLDRLPGSRQLRLWGTLPAEGPPKRFLLAIDDPALYAATAFANALGRRGVAITGRPAAHHRFVNEVPDLLRGAEPAWEDGFELARRSSPPLFEILRIIDKVSQNLHAELVLREVGRFRRNMGTREAGLEEMKEFLSEIGIETDAYKFHDGSGLSRLNLVTPESVTRLLRFMYRSPQRENWLSLLPLGGEDGTLSTRFQGSPEARRIRAKTGTLNHVGALSGYADSKSRGRLAFAVLANNYRGPDSELRTIIDKICMVLAE